jgi:hypothetical protein
MNNVCRRFKEEGREGEAIAARETGLRAAEEEVAAMQAAVGPMYDSLAKAAASALQSASTLSTKQE